ncbi:hypothetical protein GQ457_03G036100 [Hibiscus cannabinus]
MFETSWWYCYFDSVFNLQLNFWALTIIFRLTPRLAVNKYSDESTMHQRLPESEKRPGTGEILVPQQQTIYQVVNLLGNESTAANAFTQSDSVATITLTTISCPRAIC